MKIDKDDVFRVDPVTKRPYEVVICNSCGGQAVRWLNDDYYCEGCDKPHRKRCSTVRFADAGYIRVKL